MATHRLIVFTEPAAGKEAEYNEWYDQVHLKEVLEMEGFVAAQRFALSDAQIAENAGEHVPSRYLAIYEIEAESLPAALEKLNAGSGTMQMSDALNMETAKAIAFSAIAERQIG
jgi:hypothetical protein